MGGALTIIQLSMGVVVLFIVGFIFAKNIRGELL